ncbi:MAG TPA: MarR family transcriptional regulator [Candidatus Baltobacteraceae bacterium]|jgi:DNA-binding MarR family transcriptional regulator|nr:MarR family transcriptional regulator [Candidatus Baltobacteraceae bacterium]
MRTEKQRAVSTQSLLLAAYQATARELVAALERAGHVDIRTKHGAVFANIEGTGTRATVIAQRAKLSKPAMGEVIDELERLGYLTREPDPQDRRAKLLVPTKRGREVIRLVVAFTASLEQRLQKELGAKRYADLREALFAIAPDTQVQPRV